jgi:hypothetical protein
MKGYHAHSLSFMGCSVNAPPMSSSRVHEASIASAPGGKVSLFGGSRSATESVTESTTTSEVTMEMESEEKSELEVSRSDKIMARLLGTSHRFGGAFLVAKQSIDLSDSVATYFNDARTQCVAQLFANEYNKYSPPKKSGVY